ncbi:hypothetical protein POX_g09277 [Penicillium oxalicum]|uniref:Conidiation-specific protein 6 n=1 Tax=Penicillium oxalicum (strain 114-2 / CGMCC 5302) TaxID=933388 RepID=S7Z8B4_PENO1|nr:hypothetical protein POX_g09277 [Penicillium oxalicum]EPS26424.1 hypothetical protein PDE_01360 [Penicillium oxalicum 114-2]KAI2786881.1 hypothetical protein POX_g09277 [Penicillium oxalicum]
MARHTGSEENRLRGYKAAAHNPRNSSEARAHAQEEVTKLSHAEHEHERQSGQPQYSSDEEHPYNERHEENVKRGLKAAVHNPRVSQGGKERAQHKLDEMGEPVE